jgi:hypothetical protein
VIFCCACNGKTLPPSPLQADSSPSCKRRLMAPRGPRRVPLLHARAAAHPKHCSADASPHILRRCCACLLLVLPPGRYTCSKCRRPQTCLRW